MFPFYYYPNRPMLVPPDPKNPLNPAPDYINSLEASGLYVAEQKWNGDNTLIYTGPTPEFWNRHHARLHYKPSDEVLSELAKWPSNCVLNAETVHSKTKTVKHFLLVHCVMVWKSRPLAGKTWGDSRLILEDQPGGSHVVISPVWKTGFWKLFQDADGATVEGIILKNPKGKLVFSTSPVADVSWMIKIRKPSKKYPY